MNLTTTQCILKLTARLSEALGPDATLRQVSTLLHVAMAGASGTDGVTVEQKTNSSQAATSRNLKLLAVQHGLLEFFLDQADGRRRLVRLSPKGVQLVTKLNKEIT